MIVEDNPSIRKLTSVNLQVRGYEVAAMETGEAALAYIETHIVDAILLDILLPGMSGIDILEELDKHVDWNNIPVVVMSALQDGLIEDAESFDQVTKILGKPIDISELLATFVSIFPEGE